MNNCIISEYRGRFHDITPSRGPFRKPTDKIRYEGATSSQTTNATSYVAHEVKVPKAKEAEKFVPNPHRFDAVSEHHDHYKELNGVPAQIPSYLKSTTLRKPSEKLEYVSTKQGDFKAWSSPARPAIVQRENSYRPRSKPFQETSLHRQDYKHFKQPPNPSARQPDKLNFGKEIEFQTTTQSFHKALKALPAKRIERQQEMEAPPKTAFTDTSVFRADFVNHKAIKSAHLFKPESDLFRSDDPMTKRQMTTQADSYKLWPIEARVRKAPEEYKRPDGEMEIIPISRDYSNHGELGIPARSARPRTKLQRGREFPFNSITSYSTEFQRHNTTAERASLKQNTRDCNEIFPKLHEGTGAKIATSEFLDKYTRHDVPPAKIFKDNSSLFKTSARFAETSLYRDHFRGKRIKCPTDALLHNDGVFSFDHVNEQGHTMYEIRQQGSDNLIREITVS